MLLSLFSFISSLCENVPQCLFYLHLHSPQGKRDHREYKLSTICRPFAFSAQPPNAALLRMCPWGECISRVVKLRVVPRTRGPLVNGHIWYDHKGQNPHQHERHGDGDDGAHRGVVALVRAEQPAQATSDPAGWPAYIHHCGWDCSLLHGTQLTASTHLTLLDLLTFFIRQGDDVGLGRAAVRRVLQQQFALAALEADGQGPLHVRREFANDVLIIAEAGQVLAVGELGLLTADGAGQGLDLRRSHVDASEAFQAEGVPACQQLWGFKDIIVGAETHGTLSVLCVILSGLHFLTVTFALFPVPSPGLLTPSPLPPVAMLPL